MSIPLWLVKMVQILNGIYPKGQFKIILICFSRNEQPMSCERPTWRSQSFGDFDILSSD